MAPMLGGPGLVVVLLLVLLQCAANGEDESVIEPGIRLLQHVGQVVVAQKNGQLLLDCGAQSDHGPLEYQWYRDNKLLELEEVNSKIKLFSNGSLYIKKVRKRKRRTYTCVVTDNVGSLIATQVRVHVANVAKTFQREPQTQVAYVGGSARFECEIKAVPAATIIWQKQGKDLPQDHNKYTQIPSGVLHINNLQLQDTGPYRCITSYGKLHSLPDKVDNIPLRQSKEAYLTVNQGEANRRPRIIRGNQNITVKLGESVILECLVDGATTSDVTWSRADHKHVRQELYIGNKNLKIRSVTQEDAGSYVCTVATPGLDDVTETSTLTVLVPPILKKQLVSQRWPKARTVIFDCPVVGQPEAQISWFHNGQQIKPQRSHQFQDSKLVIYTVELKDSGYYQCLAENEVGQASSYARLIVWENKMSPDPPTGLKATALSSNKIFIQWDEARSPLRIITYLVSVLPQKDGDQNKRDDLVSGKHNTTMDNFAPNTAYVVYIKAFNKKGASEKSEEALVVTHESVPLAAPEITLSSESPNMIRVDFKEMAAAVRAGVIVEYKVYQRLRSSDHATGEHMYIVDGSKTSHVIRDVEPDTEYEVRVLASTKLGYPSLEDDKWPWVPIRTPKLSSSFPTPRLDVQRRNSTTAVVTWDSDGDGQVVSYQVALRNLVTDLIVHNFTLSPPAAEHTFFNLDNGTLYEVTVVVRGDHDTLATVAREFRTTEDQNTSPAKKLQAESLNSETILLTWTQHRSQIVLSYDVCYRLMADTSMVPRCVSTGEPSARITDLKPFSKYMFTVKTHFPGQQPKASLPLIAQTREDIPSAPINITYYVVKPGTVELHWKPPVSPNGVIISYIIFYNNNEKVPDTMWRNLTKTGGITQARVQELTATSYFFKLSACTKAGQGRPSQIMVVYPKCAQTQPCDSRVDGTGGGAESMFAGPGDKHLGIIVGVTIGIVCIVICIIVIVFRNRCFRNREEQYEATQSFHGNGHIPNHGNGHTAHVTTTNRLSSDVDAMTPMLTSIPENTESDSKGGGNLIVTPNGVRVNGLNRSLQNGHVPNGHVTRLDGSALLPNDRHSEEQRGLIEAMLASTDGANQTGESTEMSVVTSMDDIDVSLDDDGDTSSRSSSSLLGVGGGSPHIQAAAAASATTATREAATNVSGSAGGVVGRGGQRPHPGGTPAAAAASPQTLRNTGNGGNNATTAAADSTSSSSSTSNHLPRSKTATSGGRVKGQGDCERPPSPPLPLTSSISGSPVCSTQESPATAVPPVPGKLHVDSDPPSRTAGGQLPHMCVRDMRRRQGGGDSVHPSA